MWPHNSVIIKATPTSYTGPPPDARLVPTPLHSIIIIVYWISANQTLRPLTQSVLFQSRPGMLVYIQSRVIKREGECPTLYSTV